MNEQKPCMITAKSTASYYTFTGPRKAVIRDVRSYSQRTQFIQARVGKAWLFSSLPTRTHFFSHYVSWPIAQTFRSLFPLAHRTGIQCGSSLHSYFNTVIFHTSRPKIRTGAVQKRGGKGEFGLRAIWREGDESIPHH